MRESSVPPAVARSILVTVCSAYGGDVSSYGATRVTDARQYSQARELAVAGRQYGLTVPTHRRRVRLFDTLWPSAADSTVFKTGRPPMDLDNNRKLIAAALAAVGSGDRRALQTVYRLTATKLFAVCLRILGERSEAEDVLQEVYMTVWRKAAAFDPTLSSPMTWLIAIARNRAIDHLRTRGQNRYMDPLEVAAELADDKPTTDAALQGAQEHAKLQRCLDTLASHERAALHGAFFDGNTYEELAERMKVPLGTMKSWIRRAMIKMKVCLEH